MASQRVLSLIRGVTTVRNALTHRPMQPPALGRILNAHPWQNGFSPIVGARCMHSTTALLAESRSAPIAPLQNIRMRNVLLVCSEFDSYTFEEDGLLNELLFNEHVQMNMRQPPVIERVSTGAEALARLERNNFDMMISMMRIEDNMVPFINAVKAANAKMPIVLLALSARELQTLDDRVDRLMRVNVDKRLIWAEGGLEDSWDNSWVWPFVWQGNVSLFTAMMKAVEDRLNCMNDATHHKTNLILMVEDNVKVYSSLLPELYKDIMGYFQVVAEDATNPVSKLERVRQRPKILLATNYEEALDLYERYEDRVTGIIMDAGFPHNGEHNPEAGIALTKQMLDMPGSKGRVVISSSKEGLKAKAEGLGESVRFLDKNSPYFVQEVRQWLHKELLLGYLQSGDTQVRNLASLLSFMQTADADTLTAHAARNDFSRWLNARGDVSLGQSIEALEVQGGDAEALRGSLVTVVQQDRTKGVAVADFETQNPTNRVVRVGKGSLGGKGRGFRFLNTTLQQLDTEAEYEDVTITMPRCLILTTEAFDAFMSQNQMWDKLELTSGGRLEDKEVAALFLNAQLPADIVQKLQAQLQTFQGPIAVRSSSMFEDAFQQPFAGLYSTYMLPNSQASPEAAISELCNAVKMVYASTFYKEASQYIEATQNRVEEEKMAVIVQEVVGRRHGDLFHPTLAGVATAINFYPNPGSNPESGCATINLGFGNMVVDGRSGVTFSLDDVTTMTALGKDPLVFSSLDLTAPGPAWSDPKGSEVSNMVFAEWSMSRSNQTLATLPASSQIAREREAQDHADKFKPVLHDYHGEKTMFTSVKADSITEIPAAQLHSNPRPISLQALLLNNILPLREVLSKILAVGSAGLACPVEIEFAVNLRQSVAEKHEVHILQIRPMGAVQGGGQRISSFSQVLSTDGVAIASNAALGHGRFENIRDIVFVQPNKFGSHAAAIASEIGVLNEKLQQAGRPYLLVGPGRWGSQDNTRGIPVSWSQINGAGLIVETSLDGSSGAVPSQGTHLFQNLLSFGVGYMTVDSGRNDIIDTDFIAKHSMPAGGLDHVGHATFDTPLEIVVDGISKIGCVMKPDYSFATYVSQASAYQDLGENIYGGA